MGMTGTGRVLGCVLRYGRRLSVLLAVGLLLVCSLGTAFSPNIYVFLFFKFLCGMSAVLLGNLTVMGEWRPTELVHRTDLPEVYKLTFC